MQKSTVKKLLLTFALLVLMTVLFCALTLSAQASVIVSEGNYKGPTNFHWALDNTGELTVSKYTSGEDNFSELNKSDITSVVVRGATIPDEAFKSCPNLERVVISYTNIGDHAFDSCQKLEFVVIENSSLFMRSGVFRYCRALKYVLLDQVDEIGRSTFYGCSSLECAVWRSVKGSRGYIRSNAFGACNALHHFFVPDGVQAIEASAFPRVIHKIAFYSNNCTIDENAFMGSAPTTIYCNARSTAETFAKNHGALCFSIDDHKYYHDNPASGVPVNVPSIITPATCDTEGERQLKKTCLLCGGVYETTTETIPALGLEYVTSPTYTWEKTDGAWTCTATRYCHCTEAHVLSEAATVEVTPLTAPTCETDGVCSCTATFENEALAPQTAEFPIPALGHAYDYSHAAYHWDGYACETATAVCQNDTSHTVDLDVTVTADTTPFTCSEDGQTVYTASFSVGEDTFTDEKTEVLPAAHRAGDPVETVAIPATCGKDGVKLIETKCTVCGGITDRSVETIPATGAHTAGSPIETILTPATCGKAGLKLVTTKCADCGETLNTETMPFPPPARTRRAARPRRSLPPRPTAATA